MRVIIKQTNECVFCDDKTNTSQKFPLIVGPVWVYQKLLPRGALESHADKHHIGPTVRILSHETEKGIRLVILSHLVKDDVRDANFNMFQQMSNF